MALSGERNEVSPTIPSGVARMKGFLTLGLVTLSGVYAFLVYALKDSVGCCNCRLLYIVSITSHHFHISYWRGLT